MSEANKDLGLVTAYGYAVASGYTGTPEEFATDLATIKDKVAEATAQAEAAADSAEEAEAAATRDVPTAVNTWLSANIDPDSGYALDRTLSVANAAAPADIVGDLKSSISDLTGNTFYTYTKDKSVSGNAIPTQASEANWESAVVECSEGDEFAVKGWGGNSTRLWMFAKSDGTIISQSIQELHTNEYVHIIAPQLTKYLCVNSMYTQIKGELIGGTFVKDEIAKLNDLTTNTEKSISLTIEEKYMDIYGSLGNGYYHASFDVNVGEVYKIKAQTGSSIRTYVLISNGVVIDYADGEAWGTNHDYDVVYIVPQNGTLYINSLTSDYIGAKEITVELINQPTVDYVETAVDDMTTYKKSPNLFNGEYVMGYRASTATYESDTYCYTKPVFLTAGTYLFTSSFSTFGGGGQCAYITNENGAVSQSSDVITGTSVGSKSETDVWNNREILKFTLSEDAFVSFNIGRPTATAKTADQVNNFMLCEGTTLTDIPHYEKYFNPLYVIDPDFVNGLSGLFWKTAIFDGDSICRGDSVGTTDPTYSEGYAGRIGKANYMLWKNYGVGGGCITSQSNPSIGSNKHSVVDNIDTLYAQFPDADFIIFEGGTNDADLLGNAISDPTVLGSFTENDYTGTYDDTTFSGALETLFFKAIQYWKGKKIGYIVAQKMGVSYSSFDKDHANRRAYFERAIDICKKWGIPYLNLWDGCYLNPKNPSCYNPELDADGNRTQGYLYVDGQHLTAKGYDYISPIIEDWMKTI